MTSSGLRSRGLAVGRRAALRRGALFGEERRAVRARPRAGVFCLGPAAGWQLRARLRPLSLRLRRPARPPPPRRSPQIGRAHV